jgi:spore germination cell wall hydrolase CwlJ-like protein
MTETTSKSEASQVDKSSHFAILSRMIGLIFVLIIVTAGTTMKLEDLKSNNVHRLSDTVDISAQERTRHLECLALNIYREAGYEPFEGKVGVGQVTLNRVHSSEFPNDVCQVVYQKNVVYQRVICQFSWYCDRVHRARPVNQRAYNESMEVAKLVLLEGFRLPSLEHALFYHADYVSPGWRHERIIKIGAHIFYKKRDKTT